VRENAEVSMSHDPVGRLRGIGRTENKFLAVSSDIMSLNKLYSERNWLPYSCGRNFQRSV